MIVWGGCQNNKVRNLNLLPQGNIQKSFFHHAQVFNDCFKLTLTEGSGIWRAKHQDTFIIGRESHASTILLDKFIFIYGGMTEKEEIIDEFCVFDTENGKWHQITNIQGEMKGKSGGTFEKIGEYIYYFGGETGKENQYLNQIYKIHFTHHRFGD